MTCHASMNHIYRLVWNHVSSRVPVAKTTRARATGFFGSLIAAALLHTTSIAVAGPLGGQVISDNGTIKQYDALTAGTQSGAMRSLSWESFNIAPPEWLNFAEPAMNALVNNRLFGTMGPAMLRHFMASQVVPINPYGVQSGRGTQVSVGGFASTLNPDQATPGDARGRLFAGDISAWNVGFTTGQVGFDNIAAQLADAATERTDGRFFRWTANLSRLQHITSNNALYLSISGQWADTNLDTSKKLIEGGPYTVRAYDLGAIFADSGYLETAEFRHELGSALHGRWQALAFLDSAQMTLNRNPWAVGRNSATLSGAGAGLNWAGPDLWSARVYLAARLGATPALVAESSAVRAWVEISKGF